MKRTSKKSTPQKSTSKPLPAPLPTFTAERITFLSDRVLAGDVVTCASVEECCAVVEELAQHGHPLKKRTEWEQKDAPWTFLVE